MCVLKGGGISTAVPWKSIESILRKEFKALNESKRSSVYVPLYYVPLNVQPTEEQLLHVNSWQVTGYNSMFGNNPLEMLVGPAKLMLDKSLDAIGFHGTHKVMARVLFFRNYGVEVDADITIGKYRNNTLIFFTGNFCPAGEGLPELVQTPEQTAAVHDFAASLRTRIEKAGLAYAAR